MLQGCREPFLASSLMGKRATTLARLVVELVWIDLTVFPDQVSQYLGRGGVQVRTLFARGVELRCPASQRMSLGLDVCLLLNPVTVTSSPG